MSTACDATTTTSPNGSGSDATQPVVAPGDVAVVDVSSRSVMSVLAVAGAVVVGFGDGSVGVWQPGSARTLDVGLDGPLLPVSAHRGVDGRGRSWDWRASTGFLDLFNDGVVGQEPVVAVCGTGWDTYALDASGQVWARGRAIYGQHSTTTASSRWRRRDLDSPVAAIAAESASLVMLDVSGQVWVTGEPASHRMVEGPCRLDAGGAPVVSVAVMRLRYESVSEWVLGVDADGVLWRWGLTGPGVAVSGCGRLIDVCASRSGGWAAGVTAGGDIVAITDPGVTTPAVLNPSGPRAARVVGVGPGGVWFVDETGDLWHVCRTGSGPVRVGPPAGGLFGLFAELFVNSDAGGPGVDACVAAARRLS